MELRRRELLKIGLFGSAALMLPLERVARTQLAISNRLAASRSKHREGPAMRTALAGGVLPMQDLILAHDLAGGLAATMAGRTRTGGDADMGIGGRSRSRRRGCAVGRARQSKDEEGTADECGTDDAADKGQPARDFSPQFGAP